MNTFPTIHSERFVLRQFTDQDQENVFRGLSHPEVIKYYGISFKTFEETKIQMDWFANLEKEGTGLWWAISSKDQNVFYGAGGFNNLDTTHRKAEIGFWLLPEFWGQGIMRETMPLIINQGFSGLNLHRIEGFVEDDNANCKKAIEKIGFELEGTMRDCEFKNGKWINIDIYAKFKTK